jgi:hypothetical protein
MPNTPTQLQDLILLLRERTNMENSQFVTDAELTSYLNNSLAMLDTYLVNQFNDYKLTAILETISARQNTMSLPSNFLKLRGIDVWYDLTTPDGYCTLGEHDFSQRNRKAYPGGGLYYGPTYLTYRLQGQQVVIEPALTAPNYTYRLWYTPQYIPLVNTADTLQVYMDGQAWAEYAIVDSAVKVLAKQDLDPSVFLAQAAELKDYIIKMATPNRNSGEPKAVVDSFRAGLGGGFGWSW